MLKLRLKILDELCFNCDIRNQIRFLKAHTESDFFFFNKGKQKICSDLTYPMCTIAIKMYIILLLKNFQKSTWKIRLCQMLKLRLKYYNINCILILCGTMPHICDTFLILVFLCFLYSF